MPKGPIHDAAQRGDVAALRRALGEGALPNELGAFGQAPLHYLCREGDNAEDRLACLHVLLEAGADVNALSGEQQTPLHNAACYCPAKLVAALILEGADVNRGDLYNNTPLHWACMRRNSDVKPAKLLIKNGAAATVNVRDNSGYSPLDHAIIYYYNLRRFVPILLRAGAALPTQTDDAYLQKKIARNAYLQKVIAAGGIKDYERIHLATLTATVKSTLGLPARPARRVVEYAFHAGNY